MPFSPPKGTIRLNSQESSCGYLTIMFAGFMAQKCAVISAKILISRSKYYVAFEITKFHPANIYVT